MRHMNKYLLVLPVALSVTVFASPASAQGSAGRDAAIGRNAPVADVQTVQWGGWNTGTQYGPDYSYYGSRYGSRYYRSGNPGERSNARTQYGPDYSYYGSPYGSRYYRSGNPGERSNTCTQYGPDYGPMR